MNGWKNPDSRSFPGSGTEDIIKVLRGGCDSNKRGKVSSSFSRPQLEAVVKETNLE